MDTVHRRSSPLVELTREILDSDVLVHPFHFVRNLVRDDLAENAVTAFLQKLGSEAEQVVDVE